MNNNTVKFIITIAVLVILLLAVLKIVKILLPFAIVIVAAYIVYMVVTGKKRT